MENQKKITQTIEWIKMDADDPTTWPDPTRRVLFMTNIKNWRDRSSFSVIRSGWISEYKTINPRFRADFSLKKNEIEYKDILYWTYENVNI